MAGAKRRATRKQSLDRIYGCSFLPLPRLRRLSFSRARARARTHTRPDARARLFRSDRWCGRVFVSRLAPTIVALPRQNGSTIGSLKKRERERERGGGRERERKRRVVGNGRKVAAAVGVATGIRRGPGSPRSATSSRIGSTYHMSKQKRERERERERESLSGESAQRTRPNE